MLQLFVLTHIIWLIVKSGYGIMIRNDDVFDYIKFDQKGHDLAAALLKNSKKEKGFKIKVTGILKDDILSVKTINEE